MSSFIMSPTAAIASSMLRASCSAGESGGFALPLRVEVLAIGLWPGVGAFEEVLELGAADGPRNHERRADIVPATGCRRDRRGMVKEGGEEGQQKARWQL